MISPQRAPGAAGSSPREYTGGHIGQIERQILTGLNDNQRAAVTAIDGPLLIVAGPGSGKTRVITHRIAYLARVVGIAPYRIAAVTFTNKAAREMRQRLIPLLGQAADRVTAATFHAFCSGILRRDGENIGIPRDFAIYDDADQMALMKRTLTELELDPKRYPPRAILSAISGAKSQLLSAEGLAAHAGSYWEEIVVRAYERYDDLLRQSSAVDFDDLLLKTYQLFERQPDVAKKYQDRFVHFMIDEFQDTNVAQYAVAKQLARVHLNICVVGDPDQSIYAWRNADIRNILSFQDDYPAAKLIPLEENYRSTQTILNAAQSLIASNTQRVEKDLWTRNGSGVPITINEGYNEEEEAQFVIKEIQSLTRSRYSDANGPTRAVPPRHQLGDIAVMYRVNAQSRALEDACLRYGIPYQIVGGQKFYQRQEVKDITAYLRLIANPDDDVSLSRVINLPARGIGNRTLDHLTRAARAANISQFAAIQALANGGLSQGNAAAANILSSPFTARALASLTAFHDLIQGIAHERDTLDLQQLIDAVLDRSGYSRWLADQPDGGDERLENIQEFRASASDFTHLDRQEALTAFLERLSLVADVDNFDQKTDAITLITLHQAKGLEFPVVFMVGMEEGLLPHSRSMDDPAQVEEERRLCYVGVTRAKERLYLMRAFRRGFRGGSEPGLPSRFLLDIPTDLLQPPAQPKPTTQRKSAATAGWSDAAPKPSTRRQQPTSPSPRNAPNRANPQQPTTPIRRRKPAPASAATQPVAHLTAGDKVRHATFGDGIVTECKPSGGDFQVTVAFKDGAGIKRLLLGFAPLEKI